jgi:hypothetical protein
MHVWKHLIDDLLGHFEIAFCLETCFTEEYTNWMSLVLDRASKNLSSVCLEANLNQVAKEHNLYQKQNRVLSHEGINKTRPGDRIFPRCGDACWSSGENLGLRHLNGLRIDLMHSVGVMQRWIKSPAHNLVLLRPKFTKMGLHRTYGHCVATQQYCCYWTQVFSDGDFPCLTPPPVPLIPVALPATSCIGTMCDNLSNLPHLS